MVLVEPPKGTVIIEYDGKNYPGYYRFFKGLLTVHFMNECKNAFLHPSSDPEPEARAMLVDIIEKALRK